MEVRFHVRFVLIVWRQWASLPRPTSVSLAPSVHCIEIGRAGSERDSITQQMGATALYHHSTSRHGTARHVTSRHGAARHSTAHNRHGHAPSRHATPRHAAPRHATPHNDHSSGWRGWYTCSHQEMYRKASSSLDLPAGICFFRFPISLWVSRALWLLLHCFRGENDQTASFIVRLAV